LINFGKTSSDSGGILMEACINNSFLSKVEPDRPEEIIKKGDSECSEYRGF
jgi:hypothetical protein